MVLLGAAAPAHAPTQCQSPHFVRKISHLANAKIPQMADVSGRFPLYTESKRLLRLRAVQSLLLIQCGGKRTT